MLYKKLNNRISAKFVAVSLLSLASLSASATIHDITGTEGGGFGSNFTMLNSGFPPVTGGATNVTGQLDSSLICSDIACTDFAMTLTSTQNFFGVPWFAHDIRVFGPGTYVIDTDCSGQDIAAGRTSCEPTGARVSDPVVTDVHAPADVVDGPNVTLTVGSNQLGGHILFDWSPSTNIHVPVLWNYNAPFGTTTDPDFPAIDQTLIYDGEGWTGPCTDFGVPLAACDPTQTPTRVWNLSSTDGDKNGTPDGLRGFAMVNGPFPGQNANFNLDLDPPYTPPVANVDASATPPGVLKNIDVAGNDTDAEDGTPPGGAVTLLTATSDQGGTLVNNGDGTVDYTPVGLTSGETDFFQYTIADSGGAVSNVATVTISILVNNTPVANAVAFSTVEDIAKVINIADLDDVSTAIGSDSDVGQTLTFAAVQSATDQLGTVSGDGTTSLTYTPAADFNGTDTFTFSVNDGFENSTPATMTITVAAINDAPVCASVDLGTHPDEVLSIDVANDLLSSCNDVDGDAITLDSTTQPVEVDSMLADDGAGTLTYTPAPAFIGADSFDFTVTDGSANATATANIAVLNLGNFTMLDAGGNVFGGTNDVVFTWLGSEHTAETDVASNMTIVSEGPQDFFGSPWFAHHVRVFGPGTYSFEASNALCESKTASPDTANASLKATTPEADDIDVTGCPGTGTPTTITMTVLPGQLGVHMLFDYNSSFDIDVVNVWDQGAVWEDADGQGGSGFNDLWDGLAGVAPDPEGTWELVSRDVNGDGVNGSPMVDGPFVGFYANFNDGPGGAAGEKPPITSTTSDTRLGSGALGLASLLGILPVIGFFRRRSRN